MTTSTMVYTGTLEVVTCFCGQTYAIPDSLHSWMRRTGGSSTCPHGHSWHYTEFEDQRRKAEIAGLRRSLDSTNAMLDDTQNRLRATKGVVTKMRKRAIAGVCQFCHRSFSNVAEHVTTKHPDVKP